MTSNLNRVPETLSNQWLTELLMKNSDRIWQIMDERSRGYRTFAVLAARKLADGMDATAESIYSSADIAGGINAIFERMSHPQIASQLVLWFSLVADADSASHYLRADSVMGRLANLPGFTTIMSMLTVGMNQQLIASGLEPNIAQAQVASKLTKLTDFLDAVLVHIAAITLTGSRKTDSQWVETWQKYLTKQNYQERSKSIDGELVPPTSPDLETIDLFMLNYAHSGALGPAIIGGFAHSALYSPELLKEITDSAMLELLINLYRFAQDMTCDPTERMNLGLYLYASQNQITINQARELLQSPDNANILAEVNQSLFSCWAQYYERTINELNRLLGMSSPAAAAFFTNVKIRSQEVVDIIIEHKTIV